MRDQLYKDYRDFCELQLRQQTELKFVLLVVKGETRDEISNIREACAWITDK